MPARSYYNIAPIPAPRPITNTGGAWGQEIIAPILADICPHGALGKQWVLNTIRENPGIRTRALMRAGGLSSGRLQNHLLHLCREKKIHAVASGWGFQRICAYYPGAKEW